MGNRRQQKSARSSRRESANMSRSHSFEQGRDGSRFEPIGILAPLSGEIVPLERVPDPVFSDKMVGDGVAIDPLDSVLRAPCSGEIAQIHSGGHAVTVRTREGIEILLHVGLDTVHLKGRGFTPRAKAGEEVSLGAVLIEFDLDYIARHAKSALTLVVVTTMERVSFAERASGLVSGGRDRIFILELRDGTEPSPELVGGLTARSEAILIPNPTGLHVRPAAVLANVARTFRSNIQLYLGEKRANAKSVTAIMALDVRQGAKVVLVAQGADAREAIQRLSVLIEQGLKYASGKPAYAPAGIADTSEFAGAKLPKSEDPDLIPGVVASPGVGAGRVFQMRLEEVSVPEAADDPEHERELFDLAIDKAEGQLSALQAQLHATGDSAKAAIFAAHRELLEDPDILEIATSAIAKGKSAAFAWKSAYTTHAERLAGMKNQLLAQRANDLRDVGRRVLELITGVKRGERIYPEEAILIAEDLRLSDNAEFDADRIMGVCTVRGGVATQVAMLFRALRIPALAGVEPRALEIPNGTPVILDGSGGVLRLNPSGAEIEYVRSRQKAAEARRKEDLAHAREPAVARDGHRIEVVANVGGASEAEQIEELGGEGVGLLRSEFLFRERRSEPSEDEQFEVYRNIAQIIGSERPLIIRTLDVGGDKSLAYLPIPQEDNPFFGERGIRVGLDRPEVLRAQLRAVLRASAYGKVCVMFPMIGTLEELRDAKAILQEEAERLGIAPVPAGIMIEVPSAALMAEQFAEEADFFSIDTNDLAQYTLAMDRGHPRFAPQVDALNPAVLQLIADSVFGGHSRDRRVGVCGGIANDADAVPILIGLGVDELSLTIQSIPMVKARIRSLEYATCRRLAEQALACDTAAEVRALVASLPAQ
jgi:phosphoenolpyruvate-protein phosphotransferase